jgi:hypothetical protein
MGIAQGVACIEWFSGMDGDSGPMGLLERSGTPRPAYGAMGRMIAHFGQHPEPLGWVLLNGRSYGFVFRGAKGTVLSAWSAKDRTETVDFGRAVEVVNPLTGTTYSAAKVDFSSAPLLVLGVPDAMVKEAAANRGKPLPWGGDFSKAESVSIQMGATNVEKGLHTMAGASVADAVVAYGGSARAGSIPGGNVFVVDPGFLSYTTVPLEITVVVRRNPANDNAGFKLTYESTDGSKNLGWYTVPDNKEWHTKTWQINDAQFVGMYGFHFSLDSDGNQFNKYFIQSVTVKKVAK